MLPNVAPAHPRNRQTRAFVRCGRGKKRPIRRPSRRREGAVRHQAADWISPVNAARTTSSRSASVKPRCSCSRATTRSTKTPRFSNGTRSAAVQTVRSCESVKATMQPWSCRRDGCQPLPPIRPRKTRADDSLDNLKLYTAAHQKLSRRIKDRRGNSQVVCGFLWGKRRK